MQVQKVGRQVEVRPNLRVYTRKGQVLQDRENLKDLARGQAASFLTQQKRR